MKKQISVIFFSALLLLTACNNSTHESEMSKDFLHNSVLTENTSDDNTSDVADDNENADPTEREEYKLNYPTYEEITEQYPDKTIITIWFQSDVSDYEEHHVRVREANEYLSQHGYDFVLFLKPIFIEGLDENGEDTYEIYLQECIESGNGPDIFCVGTYVYLTDDAVDMTGDYLKYSKAGLFEPLDGYFDTEEGKALYNCVPELIWKSVKVDGKIYGLIPKIPVAYSRGYYVNAQLADKYGYDISKPISKQMDILKKVQENEKIPAVYSSCSIWDWDGFPLGDQTSGFKLIDGKATACYDDAEWIETIKTLHTLYKNGLLITDLDDEDVKHGFITFSDGISCKDGQKVVFTDYLTGEAYDAYARHQESYLKTNYDGSVFGINPKSKNKETAFKAYAAIYSNQELNDLLSYGIEGKDYNLSEDGYAENIESNYWRFNNGFLGNKNAEFADYQKILENTDDTYSDFYFDLTPVKSQEQAIENVFWKYFGYVKNKDKIVNLITEDNFDKTFEEFKIAMVEAGIDDILDEADRQLAEWKNNSN